MGDHRVLLCLLLLFFHPTNSASSFRGYSDVVDQKITQTDLRYSVVLDAKRNAELDWDINPATQTITFRLECALGRQDWIGFGFSNYGESTNADFILFWTDPWGQHHFQDAHTDAEGIIHVDQHQDYFLDEGRITTGGVSITFHREYDTCDDDDYTIDSGTTHILLFTAPGPAMAVEGRNASSFSPVLQRAQLLRSQLPDPPLPADVQTFVMHVDDVKIPAVETTYWCKVKKLPHLPTKHHIIQFEGAISPQSKGIVHHMEVFHCLAPEGTKIRDYDAPCHSMAERPKGLESCRKVIGAWAMGASALVYPKEAGYPIGGKGFSPYVMMEVHYNNPELHAGIVDSSGIRFFVTHKLREYDAGIMELGLEYTDKYAVPPNQDMWTLKGYCIPECTKVALPDDGIRIFASQLHTHLTGKKAYTKHFRDGVELPELNRDEHYSPHFQEIRKLPHHVHVMPGDALTTSCEDSTANKDEIVMGGFSISDEMCVNYVHYYPKVDLEVCKSSVTTVSLYGFFNFMRSYVGAHTSPRLGINDNYHAIEWTRMNTHLLETFYESAPLSMQCNQSDGHKFPGYNWEGMPIPKTIYPLPPTERPCLT
uniref:Dopamine beta-hydroxylase n=1 Tax=Platynereis dumerilii TaxID=6359 RepID=A0A068LMB7_PLADU|nr:dopamine beta-hydroxylase [Platynereis dumerilii]